MGADDLMPRKLEPMLATPAARPPPGDGWAFEVKWDGVRALAFAAAGEPADQRPPRGRRNTALSGARSTRRCA